MNVMRRVAGAAFALTATLGLSAGVAYANVTELVLTSAPLLTSAPPAGLGFVVSQLSPGILEGTTPYPTAVFPVTGITTITGGVEIFHSGGLALSKTVGSTPTAVSLTNFEINTATGFVYGYVNGGTTKVDLFTLGTALGPNMIPLDLTADAADALNATFYPGAKSPPFTTGLQIGIASANVPEPSTWAMLGLGFAMLGFAGFRKSQKLSLA